jgi:hypothetical protein
MSGNTNSSRTGIAEGLVQRGLAENAQNMTGALTSQAYTNGLNLADTQANQNNGAALLAPSRTRAPSATQLRTRVSTLALRRSTTRAASTTSPTLQGRVSRTPIRRTSRTSSSSTMSQLSSPFAALQQYMGIVGSNNWGSNSTGTQTTTTTPSALSTIGGLMGVAGALF